MLPWPLVRFGAASELIGRPVKDSLPFTSALGPQLIESTRVALGSDLESIGLVTHVNPQTDPDVLGRVEAAIARTSGAEAAAWWHRYSDAETPFEITVLFMARGIRYALAYDTTGWEDVLDSCGLPAAVVTTLRRRLGPLAERIDRVTYDQIDGAHRVRFDAMTADIAAATAVLDQCRIPQVQRDYLANTAPVWTLGQPIFAVRAATRESGPLDQVAVAFREVPGEHMMRAWKALRARADAPTKLGTFVAAMGTELADQFELRFFRTGEPHLEAVFTPSVAQFSRPIQA